MDIALGGDQHVTDHAQTLHIRIERAQSVGEFFRQHRNHAARKINAGGALVGIDIDGAACVHIVADIGNGHQQAPAFAAPDFGGLTIHRIVKIARIFAIDGDQGNIRQINAVQFILGAHFVWQGAGQADASV